MSRPNGAVTQIGPVQLPKLGGKVAKEAGEAAQRVAEVVEVTGSRMAKGADSATDRVGRLRADAGDRMIRARKGLGTQHSKRGAGAIMSAVKTATRRKPKPDAVRAQLANTSRELAHETSDLGQAVESLNAIIKANRKAGAAKRTRLFAGIVIGAGLAYHLDPERGKERRAATVRRLSGIIRGD